MATRLIYVSERTLMGQGTSPAIRQAAAPATVRYPRQYLMASVLWILLMSLRLFFLASRSSAHTGAPYVTILSIAPTNNLLVPSPGPPRFGVISVYIRIYPILDGWINQGHGGLTHRLVHVLTGHGCFGEYLHRISRELEASCHHCEKDVDTAQHTLEECPEWSVLRRDLLVRLDVREISRPVMVREMISSEDKWKAAVSFCDTVMLRKEIAEKE